MEWVYKNQARKSRFLSQRKSVAGFQNFVISLKGSLLFNGRLMEG